MKIPEHLKYTEEHEWVEVGEDRITMGITDFAQNELGDIVYVELPEPGDTIEKGEAYATVESVKAASDIFMPLTGEILEVNEVLEENSASLNEDPYGNWIVKVKIEKGAEPEDLMSAEEYRAFCEEEGD
ncbi:MAG: glycine cleavage system protein GcvH [Spirochaetales bacterium]|nr:glycine cleavage system protein GcvH [Spirochaetales bacterium]